MSIRDDLKAFVDGELSPERTAEVQAAVDADPALRQEVEFMKVLGFEIKRLAAEPEVAGRAKTIEAVKARAWPWWHPYGTFGRLAIAGGAAVILFAILFPVFAQSKDSAKKTAYLSELKQAQIREQLARTGGSEAEDAGFTAGKQTTAGTTGGTTGGFAGAEPTATLPFEEGVAGGERQRPAFRTPSTSEPPAASGNVPARGGRAETKGKPSDVRAQTDRSALPPAALEKGRMVIQNADVARRVEDVEKAVVETRAMTKSLGGYVESQSSGGSEGRLPSAAMVLRIPAARFEQAMERLRAMGEKIHENSNADDITKQYADLEGRIKVLRAEEDSYVTMLRGARRIGEIIEIKDRLSQVRQQLASYEQQRISMKDLSSLSTISVRFEQRVAIGKPEESKGWSEDAWATAVNGLAAVGRFLGQAVIFLFVFAPVWIPPVLLFWWLGKKAKA